MAGATFSQFLHDIINSKVEVFEKGTQNKVGDFFLVSGQTLEILFLSLIEVRLRSNNDLIDTGVLSLIEQVVRSAMLVTTYYVFSDNDQELRLFDHDTHKIVFLKRRLTAGIFLNVVDATGQLFEFNNNEFDLFFPTIRDFLK